MEYPLYCPYSEHNSNIFQGSAAGLCDNVLYLWGSKWEPRIFWMPVMRTPKAPMNKNRSGPKQRVLFLKTPRHLQATNKSSLFRWLSSVDTNESKTRNHSASLLFTLKLTPHRSDWGLMVDLVVSHYRATEQELFATDLLIQGLPLTPGEKFKKKDAFPHLQRWKTIPPNGEGGHYKCPTFCDWQYCGWITLQSNASLF